MASQYCLFVSELKKVHIEVKEETGVPSQPTGSEEEDEEDEEEDDDDDDEESEEEAEKGATVVGPVKRGPAKESDEESTESDGDDGRTKEERLYDRAKRRIEVRENTGEGGV